MPTPSPNAVRSAVHEILSREEFRERPPETDWWQKFQDWLDKLNIHPASHTWMLELFLLVLCSGLLIYFLLRLQGVSVAMPAGLERRATMMEVMGGVADSDSQALTLARRALEAGDARLALWIGHRLLLARLNASRALRFSGPKTNGQYVRELDPHHPSYPLFAEFTRQYDAAIYAQRGTDLESVGQLFRQLN